MRNNNSGKDYPADQTPSSCVVSPEKLKKHRDVLWSYLVKPEDRRPTITSLVGRLSLPDGEKSRVYNSFSNLLGQGIGIIAEPGVALNDEVRKYFITLLPKRCPNPEKASLRKKEVVAAFKIDFENFRNDVGYAPLERHGKRKMRPRMHHSVEAGDDQQPLAELSDRAMNHSAVLREGVQLSAMPTPEEQEKIARMRKFVTGDGSTEQMLLRMLRSNQKKPSSPGFP